MYIAAETYIDVSYGIIDGTDEIVEEAGIGEQHPLLYFPMSSGRFLWPERLDRLDRLAPAF